MWSPPSGEDNTHGAFLAAVALEPDAYNGREFLERVAMLAELDIVIFIKSEDNPDLVAERVFHAMGGDYQTVTSDEGDTHYEAAGLGFRAELNTYDPYEENPVLAPFDYELDIFSKYFCVDLDALALEETMSEYFARLLAFELNTEVATEILVDATDEVERLRILVFRRNPQYRLDQAPTLPKVFLVEEHEREEAYDRDAWEGDDGNDEEGEELALEGE